MRFWLFFLIGLFSSSAGRAQKAINRLDLFIRDPFILPDPATQTYYLYSSAHDKSVMPHGRNGVVMYTSKDLETWNGPVPVFEIPEIWWASPEHGAWAPEVHQYQGRYYLFATFTNPGKPVPQLVPGRTAKTSVRGTAIMVGDSPAGPFKPLADKAMTPSGWMALDGTLFVENGVPYMVFCHEWVQVADGTVEFVRLKKNLSAQSGKPKTLFRASEADWVKKIDVKAYQTGGNITDGPWFYRTKTGKLLMLWSSFGADGYAVGIAESQTGKLAGPWRQQPRLFEKNGGHAMLFRRFDGQLMLTLHQPNSGNIRARLFEVIDTGETLRLSGKNP